MPDTPATTAAPETPEQLRERVATALHFGLDDATPNDIMATPADHQAWVDRVQEWADWIHEQYMPRPAPNTAAADPFAAWLRAQRDAAPTTADRDHLDTLIVLWQLQQPARQAMTVAVDRAAAGVVAEVQGYQWPGDTDDRPVSPLDDQLLPRISDFQTWPLCASWESRHEAQEDDRG